MTLIISVLRKSRGIFELYHYSLLFRSNPDVVSIKKGRNSFPVSYSLMSVTVLFLTNCFLVLILRVFIFFLSFIESIRFLVELPPYQQVQLKQKHIWKNRQTWKRQRRVWRCLLFSLNILCFWAKTQFCSQKRWIF